MSARREVLRGGKQEGVEVIAVETERLGFTVIPTRGMGIQEVRSGDVRLGWDSPIGEVVHPRWIDLARRGGLGWLEGFGEWLVRCGRRTERTGCCGSTPIRLRPHEIQTVRLKR